MDPEPNMIKAGTPQPCVTRGLVFTQSVLGAVLHVLLAVPFLRRTHGLARLRPSQCHLLVINHISLLDTLLIATLCWRSRCYPILVLGDKNVWHASWVRRLLSRSTAFLLERGKLNPNRIRELQAFGRAGQDFQLIVFPEGTRGDGVNVASCQPGIYFIAQAAQIPIVPVFIENMQLISTKTGRFHFFRGWRKVEVHFGEPISPETYLPMPREEFLEFVRRRIVAARATKRGVLESIPAGSNVNTRNPFTNKM
jgi:1-acyl-sn-glycerol-3-phosphate acyltransferase